MEIKVFLELTIGDTWYKSCDTLSGMGEDGLQVAKSYNFVVIEFFKIVGLNMPPELSQDVVARRYFSDWVWVMHFQL